MLKLVKWSKQHITWHLEPIFSSAHTFYVYSTAWWCLEVDPMCDLLNTTSSMRKVEKKGVLNFIRLITILYKSAHCVTHKMVGTQYSSTHHEVCITLGAGTNFLTGKKLNPV
jgi:hypothetical protein